MMGLMMRSLIISALHGSCSSGAVDNNSHSRRVFAFNEKVASSSPHEVDMMEDLLDAEDATRLHH